MARILIIDDDVTVRQAIRRILEKVGYEVVEASDGEEGMRLFYENPADLVITDIFMPGKEGLETIMELQGKFPNVKIIAISGGGKTDLSKSLKTDFLMMAEQLGARSLEKPFELEELLKMVQELLDNDVSVSSKYSNNLE